MSWAGTGTLPPCLAPQFLFIDLFLFLDEETSCKHAANQAWCFRWVTCAISAGVTRSTLPSPPHPSPAPTRGAMGAPASARGASPPAGALPKHLLPCAKAKPSTTLGPAAPHSPHRDEDGDGQGSRAAACCRHYKKIPVPGRCHFPANTRPDSCVEKGADVSARFYGAKGVSHGSF